MKWHPFAERFPIPEGEAWELFKEGIRATGGCAEQPITARFKVGGGHGVAEGIDGRCREKACLELGLEPTYQYVDLADDQVIPFILRRNLWRRHLTPELRKELVAELRAAGKSQRQIAGELGVPKSTVARDAKPPAPDGAPPEREPGDDTEAIEQERAAERARPKNGSVLFSWKKAEESLGKVVRLPDELLDAYPEEKDCQERRDCERAMADFVRTFERWKQRLTRTKW